MFSHLYIYALSLPVKRLLWRKRDVAIKPSLITTTEQLIIIVMGTKHLHSV